MLSLLPCLVSLSALVLPSLAQTPTDFQPNTSVELMVRYPLLRIDPAGIDVPLLHLVSKEPRLLVTKDMLMSPKGELDMTKKFMVFMIDLDASRGDVATTRVHWFQSDLVPDGDDLNLLDKINSRVLLKQQTGSLLARQLSPPSPAGAGLPPQAGYMSPAPLPGPAHRYVHVLFEQPDNFIFPECFKSMLQPPTATNDKGRTGFDINQFLAIAGVNPRPVAGNYFKAQSLFPGVGQKPTTTSIGNNECPQATMGSAGAPPPAPPPVPPPVPSPVPPSAPPLSPSPNPPVVPTQNPPVIPPIIPPIIPSPSPSLSSFTTRATATATGVFTETFVGSFTGSSTETSIAVFTAMSTTTQTLVGAFTSTVTDVSTEVFTGVFTVVTTATTMKTSTATSTIVFPPPIPTSIVANSSNSAPTGGIIIGPPPLAVVDGLTKTNAATNAISLRKAALSFGACLGTLVLEVLL